MHTNQGNLYQILLILSGVIVTALFGAFLYREIFPEYKIYQNDYIALEQFRSTDTHQSSPPFQTGVKQIVMEREDKGPPMIDRCTSCHVALQIPYFSPTKIEHDAQGHPRIIPNEDYIWAKLDRKIAELRDKQVVEHLEASEAQQRLKQAAEYEALKTVQVGDQTYDVTKVLAMHPLIGHETYPFEFHPTEEYGCTSCHNGNGRGLVTDKAHGPVFDGTYEKEDLGHSPQFIDRDPKNDPRFSRVFNHKPGDELVFQTDPLFVGSLIQAKCVQCHQATERLFQAEPAVEEVTDDQETPSVSPINDLTLDYQRGKELYITQACYACHRIAGLARGGVGPELTLAGNLYPWYLKRKLIWPQGDLSTSTMPNMHFDHRELEDLMTFMLSQKGKNAAISKIDYKVAVQAWEGGKKMPWENPVSPAQLYDLNASMTIFATEGCAACHRLQGFESDVGFKIEKESPSFQQLYEEQRWFRQLFPEVVHLAEYDEELSGSELVNIIDKHAKEIDVRIVRNVHQHTLLEEINRHHPGVIDSYYSPFRYATRAKDHHYQSLITQYPEKEKEIEQEWQGWKERVHRVLMTYIQIYGLGRLIGPHLNWSGIYRTDEWLMEHFRNPSSHVPRSLMPVFPFDDTKFYALTYMLDQLAIRNRHALRMIWTQHGFDPNEAYTMLCAQCHGIDRVGNGAIAEWIYPIPKNLLNAEFLRNLTKEKAFYSVAHGVKGTPMPPWGEDKSSHGPAVMNQAEIQYLIDWLFTALPGGEVIRQSSDVPKWHYTPEDVLTELKNEGGNPEALFDVNEKPTDTGKHSYYIKKKYYTAQNIEAGKDFFLINCAVCHGNEADGNSIRGGVMQEAKPRILTNLDWIQSRDDLRLLRSIKYGVPGTAMTPWGDFTNSLQRLQLVMFIRSLSAQQERRNQLLTALYETFDTTQFVIENARIENSKKIETLRKELIRLDEQSKEKIAEGQQSIEKAVALYQKRLEVQQKLNQLKEVDAKYLDLQAKLRTEKQLYFNMGMALISKEVEENSMQAFLQIVNLNGKRFTFSKDQLKIHEDSKREEAIRSLTQKIVAQLETLHAEGESIKILKDKLITDCEEALRLVGAQVTIVQKLIAGKS